MTKDSAILTSMLKKEDKPITYTITTEVSYNHTPQTQHHWDKGKRRKSNGNVCPNGILFVSIIRFSFDTLGMLIWVHGFVRYSRHCTLMT